ncbi:DUF262 domain-containing protein [Planococcus halotolerans]|uniref:DUF262 domain-containing protein n=1 Tax=Planococcus halotolerans TaxID=2233542 RepID=UPI00109272BB|nr:DUF262 domain-containing protein [Planococcus halotolerans]QHJ69215.1 DUF262 domain-containing protein [Planococcus halotolerans]
MKYTFANLLEEYRIHIPIIQRDYAQGRKDEKAIAVRKQLVPLLKNAVQGEPLDFDFIYGTVKEKGKDEILYPLDGQQRLTTLFLLHWYLNMKEEGSFGEILKRFSYETRITTKEFIEHLIESDFRQKDYEIELLSEVIRNEKWFRHQWRFDPNIQGMLEMLDTIHFEFKSISKKVLPLLLDADCPITFAFMDLDQFQLGEELYIKMNARGRALTSFENFKAQFEQLLESLGNHEKMNDFSYKLDYEWTNLMWPYIGLEKTIDRPFLNIFAFISSIIQVRSYTAADVFLNKRYLDMNVLHEIYKEESSVQYLFDVLKIWSEVENKDDLFSVTQQNAPLFITEKNIFKNLVERGSVTLPERIYFYTYTQALLNGKEEKLPALLRVIRNLVLRVRQERKGEYTSNLRYDNISEIFEAVDLLIESPHSIYTTLQKIKKLPGFTRDSLEQERKKADLINTRSDLKEALFELEDLKVLSGNLSTLQGAFEKYGKDLVPIVKEMIAIDQGLVVRALLTCNDYKHLLGYSTLGDYYNCERYLYGGNFRREFLWTTPKLNKLWEEFFDRYFSMKRSSVKETLQNIIDTMNSWEHTHYAYYFIKYPIIFSNPILTFVFEREKEMLIEKLSGKTMQSIHINPIYEAVINELPHLCNKEESAVKLDTRSKLVTVSGKALWLENSKWTTSDQFKSKFNEAKAQHSKGIDLVEQGVRLVKLLNNLKAN